MLNLSLRLGTTTDQITPRTGKRIVQRLHFLFTQSGVNIFGGAHPQNSRCHFHPLIGVCCALSDVTACGVPNLGERCFSDLACRVSFRTRQKRSQQY